MSAETAAIAGRRAMEAIMIDSCVITRDRLPSDPGYVEPVLDEATGEYPPMQRVVVYRGRCRIQVRSDINSNAVEAVIGEHEFIYRTATLQLPVGCAGNIPPNSVVTMLTCPLDPDMVGREFALQAENKGKTHATHRRFRIKEVLA